MTITPDTPLAEVAKIIPPDAASILLALPAPIIEQVLTLTRDCLFYWDKHDYAFDPIQFEGVVGALVATLAAVVTRIKNLEFENVVLQSRLLAAEAMNGGLDRGLGGSHG